MKKKLKGKDRRAVEIAHKRARILDREGPSPQEEDEVWTYDYVKRHSLPNKSSSKNVLADQLKLPLAVVKRLVASAHNSVASAHTSFASPDDPAYGIVNCDTNLLASIMHHLHAHNPSGMDKLARIVEVWRTQAGEEDSGPPENPDETATVKLMEDVGASLFSTWILHEYAMRLEDNDNTQKSVRILEMSEVPLVFKRLVDQLTDHLDKL